MEKRLMRKLIIVPLTMAIVLAAACAGQRAQAPIPDTAEAREILAVMERFRAAMQDQDVDAILDIASRQYYDPMGSPDPGNDVYFEELESKLAGDFEDILQIRLDIEVLKIEFDETMPLATVSYRYDVRYQISMPSGDKWHNALEVNRMALQLEDDGAWRVISGL